jgi:sporulation protein YlmC with PRC-barrel domain
MDIPLNADVRCADGLCGRSTHVVLNPVTKQVTHLVVREAQLPHAEHVVPANLVSETSPTLIQLRCVRDDLRKMASFLEAHYIKVEVPDIDQFPEGYGNRYLTFPHAFPEKTEYVQVKQERIPPDELAVRRGAHVEATDGRVGQVDEFLVSPVDGHVTHLILREGHLWRQKDVSIPVSEISRIEEDVVYLKLDKRGVGALPTIPLRRKAA